jgi:hypothetical protein
VKHPETIRLWLELVQPAKPSIDWWEPLDPANLYYKVKLKTGETILLRQNGNELTTWRY